MLHFFTLAGNSCMIVQREKVNPDDPTQYRSILSQKFGTAYFFLKGRTQSQNNVASSSDSYSCFQILKTDEMFSTPD